MTPIIVARSTVFQGIDVRGRIVASRFY